MKAIKFNESNIVYQGENCYDLPAYNYIKESHIDSEGNFIGEQKFVITCWQPSEKDLNEILSGKPIYLQIHGSQPPVSLYTIDENGNPNEIEFDGEVRKKCSRCKNLTLESDLDQMGWCENCLIEVNDIEE